MVEFKKIFSLLEKAHQPTMLELFSSFTPFQRLVATLLSSRTKDSTVIPLAKKLFQTYPTPEKFLKAKSADLEKYLYGIGFYRVKAKVLPQLSRLIIEKYNGIVPETVEELTSLPGVGRKTANCVLAYVFHQPAIAVDTHVHRISNRLGWITTNTPEETEIQLQKIVPQSSWNNINRLFVDHGQRVCQPIKPKCNICVINKYCLKRI